MTGSNPSAHSTYATASGGGPGDGPAADAQRLTAYNPFNPNLGTQVFSYDGDSFVNLTADVGRGFGSSSDRYSWASTIFHDDILISTWNLQLNYIAAIDLILNEFAGIDIPGDFGPIIASEGAKIWRLDEDWKQVAGAEITEALDSGDTGIRSLVDNEDYIFAGTANGSFLGLETGSDNPVKLLKSSDGDRWEVVPGGPGTDPGNTSIRALDIDQVPGKLIVGTEKEDASQIWGYDLNAGKWNLISVLPVDAIGWFGSFEGAPGWLFVGIWDDQGFGIYALDLRNYSIKDVTPKSYLFEGERITPDDFPKNIPNPFDNPWLMEFINFSGEDGSHLYAGTGELFGSATLIRSDNPLNNKSWELMTADGFGRPNNYFWTFETIGDDLYTGTFAGLGNVAELYTSADGRHWEQIPLEGIVGPSTYGVRTTTGENGELILGTASSFLRPDLSKPPYPDLFEEFLDGAVPRAAADLVGLLSDYGFAELPRADRMVDLYEDVLIGLLGGVGAPGTADFGGSFPDAWRAALTGDDLIIGLYDTAANTLLEIIEDGETIARSRIEGREITLAASVPEESPFFGKADSMFVDLNDAELTRRENVEPYALFGDTDGDFLGGKNFLRAGKNSISFDVYSEDRLGGELLGTVERSFTVGPPGDLVVGLYETASDTLLATLDEGAAIATSLIEGRKVTLAAVAPAGSPFLDQVESMALDLNDGEVTRTENVTPYALFGDIRGDFSGRDEPFAPGTHTLTLDLYSEDGLGGDLLGTVERSFTLVDDGGAVA